MKLNNVLPAVLVLVAFVATPIAFTQTASPSPAQVPSPAPSPSPDAGPRPEKVRISKSMAESHLIHKVPFTYPEEARSRRIHGVVSLNVLVDCNGDVVSCEVKQGDPVLAKAAVASVMQWKYRPYLIDGQPVNFETSFQVTFN